MKILWLDINSSYSHSSLAIPSLQAQLPHKLEQSVDWKLISITISSLESSAIRDIIDYNPDVILSTIWLFNKEYTLNLLSKVSQLIKPIIILGGPEFLGSNIEFLNSNRYVASVFRGDGEEVYAEFIQKLINKEDWRVISGFCHLTEKGVYIDNGKSLTNNFKSLNNPEDSSFFNWNKPFVQLETSRGCFNNCTFCISGIDKGVQNVDINTLEERINNIYIKGIKEIRILDRTFNANQKRAIELLELFSKFSGKIRFHLEIHPAFLGVELKRVIEALPGSLLHIEAGIQSLNNEVTENCKRAGNNIDVIEGIKFLVGLKKFEIHTDLIAGLPKYSLQNIIDDIYTLCEIGPEEIQLELLKLLPGTELRDNYIKFNIKFSELPPYEVLSSDAIGYNDLLKSVVLSSILDTWYNNNVWRDFFIYMVKEDKEFISNFIEYIYLKTITFNTISKENKALLLYNFIKKYYTNLVDKITEYWLKDGLSLKKGPGKSVIEWKKSMLDIRNPITEINLISEKYYYFILNDIIIWFIYNKSISREKPIKIIHDFIINY